MSWRVGWTPGGGDEVRSDSEKFGYPLEGACGVEDDLGVEGVLQPFREVEDESGRAFDVDEIDEVEPGGADLGGELARTMGEAVE
jgi:hypothetical protein